MNYEDHSDVIQALEDAQEAEHDMRIIVRETHHFLDKRDGQWEPDIWNKFRTFGRPRYTFDQCNPVVDQIAGEMEQADFDIKVRPGGGDASEDIAKTFDGLIRNIENISNAKDVFNAAGRSMVAAGLDGWRVTQEWADGDSFDQDLFIRKIPNVVDRVWLDSSREMQSGADARHGWVLQVIPLAEYKERWPKGSEQSVNDDRESQVYSYKQLDTVLVGEFYYLKQVERTLVLMSDNSVHELNDEFESIMDELAQNGITPVLNEDGEMRTRKRAKDVCMMRLFDNGGWLGESKETVFSYVPVVLTYGNFKISENKIIYRGAIEKLLDSQRVLNYALSRDIEEGALAPRDKIWMTKKQAEGNTSQLKTLNTNTDPVQFYETDGEAQPPFRPAAATPNAGLQTTAQNMTMAIQQASGQPPVAKGDNPGLQSGIAIQSLQMKSDTQTIKWFKSQEVAIQHTAQILIDAIPRVYDTERQVRILSEDGTSTMTTLNQVVIDQQTGKQVKLNDLSIGKYDAVASAGASFQNRQQETVAAINELATLDPSIVQEGGDVLLNSIPLPGIDIIAERRRARMLQQGMIPFEQMTEEEQQQAQQMANQPPPPDPMMVAAEAEMVKAQTEAQKAQFEQQKAVAKHQLAMQDLDLKARKLEQEGAGMMFNAQQSQENASYDHAKTMSDIQNKNADTLLKMANAEKIAGETDDQRMERLIHSLPTEDIIGLLQ